MENHRIRILLSRNSRICRKQRITEIVILEEGDLELQLPKDRKSELEEHRTEFHGRLCQPNKSVEERKEKQTSESTGSINNSDWNGRYELEQSRLGTQQLVPQGPGRLGLEMDASLAMYMSKLFL